MSSELTFSTYSSNKPGLGPALPQPGRRPHGAGGLPFPPPRRAGAASGCPEPPENQDT